uniref:Uncharacterized protein n=1 Tax=Rhizophora mucronata TaxID=61149 RepID=A0A2P2LKN4_RHIMU
MQEDSSTAAIACFSIIEGILATAASLEASGIPSMPMVVVIAKSSITLSCDFDILRTPPVSTTINSFSPQKDLPYRRSLVAPGSSTTIALFPPTRRLNNADLPTFGLPTIATFGRRWSGMFPAVAFCRLLCFLFSFRSSASSSSMINWRDKEVEHSLTANWASFSRASTSIA